MVWLKRGGDDKEKEKEREQIGLCERATQRAKASEGRAWDGVLLTAALLKDRVRQGGRQSGSKSQPVLEIQFATGGLVS